MELSLRNLFRVMEYAGWSIEKTDKSYIVYSNKKRKPNHIYVPASAEDINAVGIRIVIETVAILLNVPYRALVSGLIAENLYEMEDREIKAFLSRIENNYSSFRVFKGQSILYNDVYSIITYGKVDEKFYYEYFAVIILQKKVHSRTLRVKFGDDVVGLIAMDPVLFSVTDALQQSKNAINSIFLKEIENKTWQQTLEEIRAATELEEVGFAELVRTLLEYRELGKLLEKSVNTELRAKVQGIMGIEIFTYEEI